MKNLLMVLLILMLSIIGCSSDEKIKTDIEAEQQTLETYESQQPGEKEPEQTPAPSDEPEEIISQPKEYTITEPEQTPAPSDKPEEIISHSEEYTITEPEQTPEPSDEPEEMISQSKVYNGEDRGIGGPIVVSVTINCDKITQIEVVSHNETKGVSENAIVTIISSIIEKQSTDVDAVSGATITSKALMNAVKNALENKE
jgi:uncharacterized protein with FMN-binding domain